MRHHQSYPSDDSGRGDAGRRGQRRRRHDRNSERARCDAKRTRFLFGQRHDVHPPPKRNEHGGADRDRTEQRQQVGHVRRGQAAEQPERHGRQLVVRIGKIFHQADTGAKQGADHHAGQHQDQDRIARAHGRSNHVHRAHSEQAAKKCKSLNCEHAERKKNADHRAEGCARGGTENVGRHQRIAERGPGTRCRRPPALHRPAPRQAHAARGPAG